MKLVIVESPAKAKAIQKYLGNEYNVIACMGHIMDLAKGGKFGIGVDVNKNFKTYYTPSKDKLGIISDIINSAEKCDEILLVSDPDREGEAIAKHLKYILQTTGKPMFRAKFHEITKVGVHKGIKEKHDIDMNMAASQEARRVL